MPNEHEIDSDDSELYEVEKIVDERFKDEEGNDIEVQYRVRWKGYPPGDDTWEPLENLEESRDLIEEFKKKRVRMPTKHVNILKSAIDEKDVSELPGIGKVTQARLAELGFAKCYQLFGKYMRDTEQVFKAFLLEETALTKKNAEACTKAIKEYLENEKSNFLGKTNSDQPNVMEELVSGLNAQKLHEDSPTKKAPQEAAKPQLELWKKSFAEILQNMETIPEEELKTLYEKKQNMEGLISDTNHLSKMHNKKKFNKCDD